MRLGWKEPYISWSVKIYNSGVRFAYNSVTHCLTTIVHALLEKLTKYS